MINAINISKPTKNNKKNIFKPKRKAIKKSRMKTSKKKMFKSKLKEIKEILYDPIIDRDEKIEEILFDPTNNPFKPKVNNYEMRIGNSFSSNYIESKISGDKDKKLSIRDYLDEIKPHLNDMINDHKTQGEWKIPLTIAINFFFLLKILKKFVICIVKVIT